MQRYLSISCDVYPETTYASLRLCYISCAIVSMNFKIEAKESLIFLPSAYIYKNETQKLPIERS